MYTADVAAVCFKMMIRIVYVDSSGSGGAFRAHVRVIHLRRAENDLQLADSILNRVVRAYFSQEAAAGKIHCLRTGRNRKRIN